MLGLTALIIAAIAPALVAAGLYGLPWLAQRQARRTAGGQTRRR